MWYLLCHVSICRQVEKQVVEVARLQEILAEKVLEQVSAGFAKLSTFEDDDTAIPIPIPIPAEYDDTDIDINAGCDSNHSANFRRRWKLNDVLLSRKPLGPTRLAGYAANKCYLYFVKIVHRIDRNVY